MFILHGKDASRPAGNWFQLLMILFTNICSMFSSPDLSDYDRSCSGSMVLEVYPLSLSKAVPRCMPWKGRIFGAINLLCATVSQSDSFILFANLAAHFCTRINTLTWPSLYGSQHTAPYTSIGLTSAVFS